MGLGNYEQISNKSSCLKHACIHQFHDLDTDFDLHRITSGFHGAFATGVACQQGTLTLPDTWVRPPLGLANAPIVETKFLDLPCLYSNFHLEYPLVLSRFCHVYKRSSTHFGKRMLLILAVTIWIKSENFHL